MKILIVECTAEELRANRTVMDVLNDALRDFTYKMGVSGLSGKLYVDEPDDDDDADRQTD